MKEMAESGELLELLNTKGIKTEVNWKKGAFILPLSLVIWNIII
jgi:hypothetical protein